MNLPLTQEQLNARWYIELAEQAITNAELEKAELYLTSALNCQENNVIAITLYGKFLINERRFIEAERLLKPAYKLFHKNLDITLTYYMSLRRQGLITECINLCIAALEEHSDNHYLKSELAVALVMSGNIKQALKLSMESFEPTLRCQQWLISAQLSTDNNKALELIKLSEPFFSEVEILPQQAIQAIANQTTHHKIRTCYEDFTEKTKYSHHPTWCYFELLRYCRVQNDVRLFEQDCDLSLALDPTPYHPRVTGKSHILFDDDEISIAKQTFTQPVINKSSLKNNIEKFRGVCRALIQEGVFDHFKENIETIKNHFAPNIPDFVQVMSTGRCGTLALYEFLKKSDQVIPFHTMQSQLIPPDRNHLLYRIVSGNLDKKIIQMLLSAYLTNRVSEICYAYTKQRTPVIINHWDTIFAPFLSELFPTSNFLHLWRADEEVFKSIYGKNQFQNEQLRHCFFNSDFPQGNFICFFDTALTMQQQISWYLLFTREYSLAFKSTLPEKRMSSMRSEDLFSGNIEKFQILKELMPIDDISDSNFIASFAKPINQKKDKVQIENTLLDKKASDILKIVEKLKRIGTL